MSETVGFTVNVDEGTIADFEKLVTSDEFTSFLLSHTTDFSAAALALDTLFKKLDELKG
jgi:hypothetical protein